jgi:hypothetical protein
MLSARELIKLIYTAFNKREMDTVLAHLHPDVDWPNGMEGGRVHGRAGVREYWTRQWGLIDPHVEPVSIEDDPSGRTIVDVHQVVRDLSGKILADQMIQHVYFIRNGLIERMDIQSPDRAPGSR